MTESELVQEALRLWKEDSLKPKGIEPVKPKRTWGKSTHGTASHYQHHGCRCPLCTEAHRVLSEQQRADRKRRMEQGTASFKHGQSGYRNWGCRCEVCSEAQSTRERERYLRNKEKKGNV